MQTAETMRRFYAFSHPPFSKNSPAHTVESRSQGFCWHEIVFQKTGVEARCNLAYRVKKVPQKFSEIARNSQKFAAIHKNSPFFCASSAQVLRNFLRDFLHRFFLHICSANFSFIPFHPAPCFLSSFPRRTK
jgi:hypothetical protein